MAVVTTKSGVITNRDASPKVFNNASVDGGSLKAFAGTVEAGAGDSIASKYIMASIPSNARVHQLMIMCDALTAGAVDLGIYKSTADGGAVVDADFFASAQSLASALAATDVTNEAGNYGPEKAEMPLWQALGLSADPCLIYDVVATVTTAITAAGTVSVKGTYAS